MPSEIQQYTNPRRETFLEYVTRLEKPVSDYAVVLFSGHDGQKREIILELNLDGETASESGLWGLSASFKAASFPELRIPAFAIL